MGDPRPPKERVFTREDVEKAAKAGKVYDPRVVDFVPLDVPEAEAALLAGGRLVPTVYQSG